jgi:uncharacterized membrane protein
VDFGEPSYLGKLGGFLNDNPEIFIWAVGAIFVAILLIIFTFIWRRIVAGRVRSQTTIPGMDFTDVERMRKEGLVNEEEYKTIKRKVAERTLAETRKDRQSAEDEMILRQAAVNPDAVRQFVAPETDEGEAETARPAPATRPAPGRSAPPRPAQRPPAPTAETPGDPLAGLTSAGTPQTPPKPSMNMPRAAAEKQRSVGPPTPGDPATPGGKSELDLLFEQGAISREEYERLKGFFQK